MSHKQCSVVMVHTGNLVSCAVLTNRDVKTRLMSKLGTVYSELVTVL